MSHFCYKGYPKKLTPGPHYLSAFWKRFSVNWEHEDFDDYDIGPTYGDVYADGRQIGEELICPSGRHATGSAVCVNQIMSSDGKICPFVFGQTELSGKYCMSTFIHGSLSHAYLFKMTMRHWSGRTSIKRLGRSF